MTMNPQAFGGVSVSDTPHPSARRRPGDSDLQIPLRFDGPAYDPAVDAERLVGLLRRVFLFMAPGQWVTISEAAQACHGTESGVGAMMRKLRRKECGGHHVERRRHPALGDHGVFQYRLEINHG